MPNRSLQLLHTSDCHLDGDFPYRHDRHLTSRYFASFRRIIDKTLELDVDILVIAGDFFDSNRASSVSTDFALHELARTRSHVIISPGNHDSVDEGSVYKRVDFSQAGKHVHILTDPRGEEVLIPELETRVWGPAGTEIDPGYRPLKNVPPREGDFWHIAVAHGHFMEDRALEDRWAPISEAELESANWDYLALGHWDHFVDVSHGPMRAVYSGSAVAARDADHGTCARVMFDPGEEPSVSIINLRSE